MMPDDRDTVQSTKVKPSPFLMAAAVLTLFDPETIHPAGKLSQEESRKSFNELIAKSFVSYDRHANPFWSLRRDVRRRVLERLGDRKAILSCLRANPKRVKTSLQKMLEKYLEGQAPPVSKQNSYQLSDTLQIVDWLGGIVEGVPPIEHVQERLDRKLLVAPLLSLVDDHFRGRTEQLDALRSYIGVLKPKSGTSALVQRLRNLVRSDIRDPLLICGAGGIGKSTLLAKCILEHSIDLTGEPIPFAYLDLDRPALLAREPLTLLAEAARQLAAQFPRARNTFIATSDFIRQELARVAKAGTQAGPEQELGQWRVSDTIRNQSLDDFGSTFTSAAGIGRPLLLVVDTFERLQFRGNDYVEILWDLLKELRARVPKLRTVLSGRAPLDPQRNFYAEVIRLDEFDHPAAVSYLKSHGIREQSKIQRIIEQVGRGPLSLKLAVEILQSQPESSELVPSRVNENLVQGILYRRILRHIKDDEVRKLAHPGLILRRISPDIIQHVLAEPCGLDVPSEQQAKELFAKLRREVSVVGPSDDGSMRHRPELRQLMVQLLWFDEPKRTEEIQRRAIEYYAKKEDPVSRAEEIYHRLAIGEDPKVVRNRWIRGVEEYLAGPWDELPVGAQTFLAARTGFELDAKAWRTADLESAERRALKRAEDFLARGNPERALSVAREIKKRSPASPLHAIDARAFLALQNFERARRSSHEASLAYAREGKAIPIDVLLVEAELDQKIGLSDSPESRVRSFREAARHYRGDLGLLRIGLNELAAFEAENARPMVAVAAQSGLTRLNIKPTSAETRARSLEGSRRDLLHEILSCVRSTKPELLDSDPELSRQVFVEIAFLDPQLALGIIRRSGFGSDLVSYVLPDLVQLLALWDAKVSAESSSEGVLSTATGLSPSGSYRETWSAYLGNRQSGEAAQLLDQLLERHDVPPEVYSKLVEVARLALRRKKSFPRL